MQCTIVTNLRVHHRLLRAMAAQPPQAVGNHRSAEPDPTVGGIDGKALHEATRAGPTTDRIPGEVAADGAYPKPCGRGGGHCVQQARLVELPEILKRPTVDGDHFGAIRAASAAQPRAGPDIGERPEIVDEQVQALVLDETRGKKTLLFARVQGTGQDMDYPL